MLEFLTFELYNGKFFRIRPSVLEIIDKNSNEAVSRHGPVQGAEDEIGYCLDLQMT